MALNRHKSRTRRAARVVKKAVASVISAPSRAKHAIRGRIADHKRGKLLRKQGFRPTGSRRRASTFGQMARKGKKNLKRK